MPNSIRERILQAAVGRIASAVGPLNAEVHRSPTVALTREQAPAVVVFPESDEVTERPNDRVERQLVVRLVSLARGTPPTPPETEADALLVAAHAALMVETTVGGLVSLVLGSLMLFRSADPAIRVSLDVIFAVTAFTAAVAQALLPTARRHLPA